MGDILKKFEEFGDKLQQLEDERDKVKKERFEWCDKNRKEIKKELFPIKNKVYKIKDINTAYHYHFHSSIIPIENNETYFFRSNDTRFVPHRNFDTSFNTYPYIKGDILDSNLRKIEEEEIYVTSLEQIDENSFEKLQDKITKLYVMIDKSTGYYNIGKSKKPEQRRIDLQRREDMMRRLEKDPSPEIEILYIYDARVKDVKKLCEMFEDKQIKGNWFDLSGSDLKKIKEYFS